MLLSPLPEEHNFKHLHDFAAQKFGVFVCVGKKSLIFLPRLHLFVQKHSKKW